MSASVFNVAKGRAIGFYERVKNNDPANSAFGIVALKATGLESHAILKDYDTLAAILAGASDEATNTGYARKVLTDADLAALPAPDDTLDRRVLDFPDQAWSSVAAAGGAWGMLIIYYDPDTTTSTDADRIPVSMHDFAKTPDGSDITAQITDFLRAA